MTPEERARVIDADPEKAIGLLRAMLRVRRLEERCVELALADRMRGRLAVTACFFGEGAVAEGEFHECMNLAALWRLPVLFLCENARPRRGHAGPHHARHADARRAGTLRRGRVGIVVLTMEDDPAFARGALAALRGTPA